jgi:hypothetical protein
MGREYKIGKTTLTTHFLTQANYALLIEPGSGFRKQY